MNLESLLIEAMDNVATGYAAELLNCRSVDEAVDRMVEWEAAEATETLADWLSADSASGFSEALRQHRVNVMGLWAQYFSLTTLKQLEHNLGQTVG